jgi:hypothetical protein
MTRLVPLCVAAALLFACPRSTGSNVAGTADEQMDLYASQLEELRTRATATDMACGDWCSLKTKVCSLRDRTCDLASSAQTRDDFQQRCTTAQEDCARFNDSCTSCKG